MSKILKILKNHQNSQNSHKILKNSQNSQNSHNSHNSQISQNVQLSTLLYFFSFVGPTCHSPCGTLGWGLSLCLQLNRIPVHHGTERFMCIKTLNLKSGGGGEQMGTLGKNGAWGDATCTCPRTCVPRPCSSLCMVTRVLALQVWLSIC